MYGRKNPGGGKMKKQMRDEVDDDAVGDMAYKEWLEEQRLAEVGV